MHADSLRLPPKEEMCRHIISSFRRYWPKEGGEAVLFGLPMHECACTAITSTPCLITVALPPWAMDCGVEGILLIPSEACANPNVPRWQEVDWWLAAFLFLEAWHERLWEQKHDPVHSYSVRLKGWDRRMWDRAWANRIALFLRRWGAQQNMCSEETIFGSLPDAEFLMTHDVDAIEKTSAIRLKQSLFMSFNAFRSFLKGDWKAAFASIKRAFLFFFTERSWWFFDDILALESASGVFSCFNFFADERSKTPKRWLFDPSYNISEKRFRRLFSEIKNKNAMIGLHPSFDSWNSAEQINSQRKNLESICGAPVQISRQHWLRFSWESTPKALENAGMKLDTTLMFNDRPGFRVSAALQWRPFNQKDGIRYDMEVLPTVFMDSHFYDYNPMTDEERQKAIAFWIREVQAVRGQIALLWHPHTLSRDYGWKNGFIDTLSFLKGAEE